MTNQAHVCAVCGHHFAEEELTAFDELLYCRTCLDTQTVVCRDCGERIYRRDNVGSRTHPLCEVCYDDAYTQCERCDALLRRENAYYLDDGDEPYCHDCYRIKSAECIHEYGYKPTPIFYGEGTRYFGMELEIDHGGEEDSSAEKILEIGNRENEHIYCKHDGSLSDGFEIVTQPMTLAYHREKMPWGEITDKARGMGYTSHIAGTCGLHIHVNRSSLGEDSQAQEGTVARILYFIEKNWNELLIFSRRTQDQLNRWAQRYGYKEQPQQMLQHAKSKFLGRYMCVNLTNYTTIEFRLFRGTLKLNTLIATLQMVNRICDVAVSLSDEELRDMSWDRFVREITEPELIRYLQEREIYKTVEEI